MQARHQMIPDAVRKYDVLSALGCHALSLDRSAQRLVLRLITLITARYNWRTESLTVGQREIARLWSVDERTVKREMAKLRTTGWLRLEAPGRRGRVAAYSLDLVEIGCATRAAWARVGPDFETRMAGNSGSDAAGTAENIVPFPGAVPKAEEAPDPDSTCEWSRACDILRASDAAVFDNWFRPLRREGRRGGVLHLRAPSAFHVSYIRARFRDALLMAMRKADPSVTEVRVFADDDAG